MSDGDGVKRVKSSEFTGISPLQLAGTGVKLVKTRVVFVGIYALKRVGDRILPCRRPLDAVKGSDNTLFHLTVNVCVEYQ